MRTVKLLLVSALLLATVLLAGCNEQHTNANSGVQWRPTQTGFFAPEIAYSRSDWPLED